MLDKEFQFYLSHQEELVQKYSGKFLVIKDEQIIGIYDTKEDAYIKAQENYELGSFLIQFCENGSDSYTQTFHSRVAFA